LRPHNVVWKYDQYWENKLNIKEVQQSQMEELHFKYRNVVTEFQIPLAVVKSEETDKKHRYEQHLHLPDGSVPVDVPSNIVRY
jgi:hypothetical protein